MRAEMFTSLITTFCLHNRLRQMRSRIAWTAFSVLTDRQRTSQGLSFTCVNFLNLLTVQNGHKSNQLYIF